jgi:O-antigen/teichoic acid export membrane protein
VDDGQDLKRKAVQSTAWLASNRLVTQIISWAVTLILARLLAPADYGLFAMAVAVIAFLEMFQEFGVGAAIVQRQHLTQHQLSTVFWTMLGASAVIAGAAVLGAPVAARFYHEPRLVPIIQALSVTFLVNSMGTVPFNLITKAIDFRRRFAAEAVAVVVSSALAVYVAWRGFGVWALVAGTLGRAVSLNLAALALSRWLPRFEFAWNETRDLLRFGLRVAGGTAAQTLSNVANTAILGRLLGRQDLGYYSVADSLGRSNPLHRLSTSIVTQLSLPIFSRLQTQEEELRRYFVRISRYLATIALPLQVGTAIVAFDLVAVFLSEKWLPVAPVVQLFSLGGIMSILPLASFPLLTARGQVTFVLRYHVFFAAVMVVVSYVAGRFGLMAVATSWAVVYPVLRLIPLARSLREVNLSLGDYLRNISASLLATVVMAAVLLVALRLPWMPRESVPRLILCVAIGALTYIPVLFLADRGLTYEVRQILRELRARPGA